MSYLCEYFITLEDSNLTSSQHVIRSDYSLINQLHLRNNCKWALNSSSSFFNNINYIIHWYITRMLIWGPYPIFLQMAKRVNVCLACQIISIHLIIEDKGIDLMRGLSEPFGNWTQTKSGKQTHNILSYRSSRFLFLIIHLPLETWLIQ